MPETKTFNLPINYEVQSFDDDRITKVKIWVMHDGLNKNYSFFSMDAINNAAESIKNIPILAFVRQVDGSDNVDFAGHEFELVLTDNEFKYRYLGRPIGIIPEVNNDYHIEIRDDKHYVVVNGYIWNDYANEALDILKRDGVKGQSMEIRVDDYEYDYENDYYVIKKYRYTGLTLLGDDVTPAMDGAKVELASFSKNDRFNEAVMQMSKEFKEYFASVKGGVDMAKKDEKEKEVFEVNDVQGNEDIKDENVADQFDEAVKDVPVQDTPTEEAPQEEFDSEDDKSEGGQLEEKFTLEDALVKIADLQMELNEKDNKIKELEAENKELKQFKDEVLKEKHEAQAKEVIEEFRSVLEEEVIEEFASKIHECTIDQLRTQLMVKLGEKALHTMTKKRKQNTEVIIPVQFSKKDQENKTEYDKIIEKFIK